MFFVYLSYSAFYFVVIKKSIRTYFRKNSHVKIDRRREYKQYYDVLIHEFPYFKHLNNFNQKKFIYRTIYFVNDKEWRGFYDFVIEKRHKILIAATAIQLTFGLEDFKFNHLIRILVAPRQFYSRLFERDVKGLTMAFAVYFSWYDFEDGIKNETDSINLGLHEFAHSFDILHRLNANKPGFVTFDEADWQHISEIVFQRMHDEHDYESFLREYAKVNKNEFFAVLIETFFERPELVQNNEPKLYHVLCNILNQNPLNRSNNYHLETEFKEEIKQSLKIRINELPDFYLLSTTVLGFAILINTEHIFLNLVPTELFLVFISLLFLPTIKSLDKRKYYKWLGFIILGLFPIAYISIYSILEFMN
ncbi:MAG: zinc-dependent peptidase [Bacteroidota bacterium]|nr:zinc-dependent peptidase [Bacteroidota bacterium]